MVYCHVSGWRYLQAASCDMPIEGIGIHKQQSALLTFVHLKLVLTVENLGAVLSPRSRLLCGVIGYSRPRLGSPGSLSSRRRIGAHCEALASLCRGHGEKTRCGHNTAPTPLLPRLGIRPARSIIACLYCDFRQSRWLHRLPLSRSEETLASQDSPSLSSNKLSHC